MKGTNLMKTTKEIKKTTEFCGGIKKALVPRPPCTSVLLRGFIFFSSLFFILSCEQPFKAGLGPVVDVRPPTVRLDLPGAGEYIWGTRNFVGFAEDDYILDKVELMVTNYPDDRNPYRTYQPVSLTKKSPNKGDWELEIDTVYFTETFGDGDLKVRIRATDSAKKIAETDEIVFMVKNNPPEIIVAAPYIARGILDGEIGGEHLNYGATDTLPPAISYQRQMDKGGFISGTISFDEDIYTGRRDIENNRYPPQIRLWRVNDMRDPDDTEGYLPGQMPPLEYDWQDFVLEENLFILGIGSYQFTYNLPEEAGRFYGFEIRAQSKDGRSPFHYPRDFYMDRVSNPAEWENPVTDFTKENGYVLIYVRSPREFPIVEIYDLEDITGPNGWDSGANPPGYKDIAGINDNMAHPFVNKITVSKNGAFTLRIKASHSEGISSAEVYWEKEDGSERGRFIWDDPADTPTHLATYQVEPRQPYSYWGFRDPNVVEDGFYTTRNFIFTYKHDGKDTIPSGNDYHEIVRGRSKVQTYKGSNWQLGKQNGLWPTISVAGEWEDKAILTEGVYNIEVYARSAYGTAATVPFTCSIRLDEGAPEAEIIAIDGAFSQDLISSPPHVVVNGVVQPRLRFSDSRPLDAGIRTATDDYHIRPGTALYGYDQRYILVGENDHTTMDKIIAAGRVDNKGGWWPPVAAANGVLTIPEVTVYKHGAIFDSNFKFKTSKIYSATETDTLEDGTYWLYVFVRDNAFNVGRTTPLKVVVDKDTDLPRFDFSVGLFTDKVTDPDANADGKEADTGFIGADGVLRNRLGANNSVRLRITDDDSLDLGVSGAAASQVKIRFAVYGDTAGLMDVPVDTRQFFAAQNTDGQGNRLAVRERQGEINQGILLNLLRADLATYDYLFDSDPASYTSLPDGLYQLEISITDYAPLKLRMADADPLAKVETTIRAFWLAVDTVRPVITIISPPSGDYVNENQVTITGTVSDKNGPMSEGTTNGIYVTKDQGSSADKMFIDSVAITQIGDTDVWNFAVVVKLDGDSGDYMVNLEFQDRFGNFSSTAPRYVVDIDPPEVSMTKEIDVFERDFENVNATKENRYRLANGVVSFSLSAIDNSRVEGLRWWLLPADKSATADGIDDVTGPGQVIGYNAYPSQPGHVWDPDTDNFYYGELPGTDLNQTQYINTTLLDDGEYYLHVLAIDTVGNVNKPDTHILQTIYILQEEDAPYFDEITPTDTDTVDKNEAVIRGTIFEDDGFTKTDISAGTTIKMWINDTAFSMSFDKNNDLDTWFATATLKTIANPVADLANLPATVKDLTLEINLFDEFPDLFKDDGTTDGMKYYVIEATDSATGKINDDGTADTSTRVSRRISSCFMYDTVNPEINLSYPSQGNTFGPTANSDFYLTGSIKDANLRKDNNGRYYIYYKLDNETETPLYLTGINSEGGTWDYIDYPIIDNPVGGNGPQVNFTIPADVFTSLINFYSDDIVLPDDHTLSLLVQDKSGKDSTFILSFIKDLTPPQVFLSIDEVSLSALGDVVNWWTMPSYTGDAVADNKSWNDNKRTWLNTHEPPVIYYNSNNPTLSGSFDDDVSPIDRDSFKYWIDGETGYNTGEYRPDDNILDVAWDGDGKNLRWTVYLTHNGKSGGNALPDGVHTIRFYIADTAGNEYLPNTLYAFRIDSARPEVKITSSGEFFGNDLSFAITGTARDANLKDVRLHIVNKTYPNVGLVGTNSPTANAGLLLVEAPEALVTWSYVKDDVLMDEVSDDDGNPPAFYKVNWSYDFPLNNTVPDGVYEVTAVSIDHNKIESEQAKWTFTKDTVKPTITFNNLEKGDDTLGDLTSEDLITSIDAGFINTLTDQNPQIRGSVDDGANGTAITSIKTMIQKWNWEWATEDDQWDDVDQTGADVEGWKGMDNFTPGSSKTVNWTKALPAGSTEGLYRIKVKAVDSGGNEAESGAGWRYFFFDRDAPLIQGQAGGFYSLRNATTLSFNVLSISDANLFKSVTVSIKNTDYTSDPWTPDDPTNALGYTKDPDTGVWTAIFSPSPLSREITNLTLPDGRYDVVFTVVDMAGRTGTDTKEITIDSTPPVIRVTNPQGRDINNIDRYPHENDTKIGGEEAIIEGTTNDTSNNNSESGVAGMWYHLGYLDDLEWPTETAIRQSVLPGSTTDSGANNDYFDAAAKTTGANSKAWFRFAREYDVDMVDDDDGTPDGKKRYPTPEGLDPNTSFNVYGWRMRFPKSATASSGDLKQYTEEIEIKGRTYNDGSGPQMTQLVPDEVRIYSLPLWIRVADRAGNVSYYGREIWIDPDGDIPKTTISIPIDEYDTLANARGGTVGVEGTATDNTEVYNVVYRVFVDGEQNPNAAVQSAWNTPIVLGEPLTPLELAIMTAQTPPIDNAGWTNVVLQGARGDRLIPWNISLNAEGELTSLINHPTTPRGFDTDSDGIRDTVRVLVEIYVFDGTMTPKNISINDGTVDEPKPFRRVFFLKNSAPNISDRKINGQSYEYAGSIGPRPGTLTFTAKLDSGSDSLSLKRVEIRRPEDGFGWKTVFNTAGSTDGLGAGYTVSVTPDPVGQTQFYNFSLTVNTMLISIDNWGNNSGDYRLTIKIADEDEGAISDAIEVGVDNFAPVAERVKHITSGKVAGSSADFLGRAFDYVKPNTTESPTGQNRGIKTIYAWFMKKDGGVYKYVNMETREVSTLSDSALKDMPAYQANTRNAAINLDGETVNTITITNQGTLEEDDPPIPYPDPEGEDGWVKVLSSATAIPGNGILWTANYDASDVRWSFQTDTTKLPTGPITLHYIVVDNSGNASYYTQETVVMNKPPILQQVTLTTSDEGNGAVYETESAKTYILANQNMRDGYLNAGFISKGQNIGFKVETITGTGNNRLNYRLQYVTRTQLPINTTGLTTMGTTRDETDKAANINLYTIASLGSIGDNGWKALGVDNPVIGAHFVFNPTADAPTLIANAATPPVVWKYTEVNEDIRESFDRAVTSVPTEDNFSFEGSDYFGTDKIDHDMSDVRTTSSGFFLIRVWDQVNDESTDENDQLHDAVVIFANVYLGDSKLPEVTIYDLNPYLESAVSGNPTNGVATPATVNNALNPRGIDQNVLRGGLFNIGTLSAPIKSGYIDPRVGSNALLSGITASDYDPSDKLDGGTNTTDKISGKIILRGKVYDNQQIASISIKVGTAADAKQIIYLDTTSPSTSSTYRKLVVAANTQASVFEKPLSSEGHTAEWAYVLDTEDSTAWSTLDGGPASLTIEVTATDETANVGTDELPVDIVPYITGFQRETPTFSTTRSRQGWYSFYKGEPNIAILGYNLGKSTSQTVTVTLNNGTPFNATYNLSSATNVPVNIRGRYSFVIPVNAESSKINVTAGTTSAWNHSSLQATRSWNREYSNRYAGSELWTNKPHAHIWQANDADRFADSGGVGTPSMALQYTSTNAGTLHGVWANSGVDSVFYANTTNQLTRRLMVESGDPYKNTDIDFWNYTSTNPNVAADGDNYSSLVLSRQDDGNPTLRVKAQVTTGEGFRNEGDRTTYVIGRFLSSGTGGSPTPNIWVTVNRWQNARIRKAAASTSDAHPGKVFVSAYDSAYQRLFFTTRADAMTGDNGNNETNMNDDPYYLDGGGSGTNDANNITSGILGATRAYVAGEYSAVDYDSNGRPVVAYYDQTNDTLRLAYASDVTPNAGNQWTRRYVLDSTDPLFLGSGTHVSMKIQRTTESGTVAQGNADIIHLAFYNSDKSALVYARGTRTGGFTAYVVDNVVKGGTFTDISLEQRGTTPNFTYHPWIVYADSTRIGEKDGARIAYRDPAAYTRTTNDPLYSASDANSQGWEALTMPANFTVNKDRLNIEAWPPQHPSNVQVGSRPNTDTWNAAIGYGSDYFRIGYFFKPADRLMTNADQTRAAWQLE